MLLGTNCMETFTSATSRDLKKNTKKVLGNKTSNLFKLKNELTKYAAFRMQTQA